VGLHFFVQFSFYEKSFPLVIDDTLYRVSQELRTILRDLIPELILSKNALYAWAQLETVKELGV
jgi:hypothetical protein